MASDASQAYSCVQVINEQKRKTKIKRDNDVTEICLSDRKLEGSCDFGVYSNLKYLWLSNNRLRRITGLANNYRIKELHLQYNLLKDITGVLEHLTQLEVLMLQGNQLTNLEKVVHEFRRMQHLQILNMFDNPIAQEKDYRHYTLHHITSVTLLDRKEVTIKEIARGRRIYDQENEMVRDTLAFMTRSQGPPNLYFKRQHDVRPIATISQGAEHHYNHKPSVEELKEEFETRIRTKALWTYNHFDWSKIPNTESRRLQNIPCLPEIQSMTFK